MSAEQILANNERLQKAFQALDAKPDATVAEWEELAMEYFAAGYMLNASTCFIRADAIKDSGGKRPRSKAMVEMLEVAA